MRRVGAPGYSSESRGHVFMPILSSEEGSHGNRTMYPLEVSERDMGHKVRAAPNGRGIKAWVVVR